MSHQQKVLELLPEAVAIRPALRWEIHSGPFIVGTSFASEKMAWRSASMSIRCTKEWVAGTHRVDTQGVQA
jgi:hypothetical protein